MLGCSDAAKHHHSLGPGTYIMLCSKHYQEILEEISDESSRPDGAK